MLIYNKFFILRSKEVILSTFSSYLKYIRKYVYPEDYLFYSKEFLRFYIPCNES